jgi:hypothetical protein
MALASIRHAPYPVTLGLFFIELPLGTPLVMSLFRLSRSRSAFAIVIQASLRFNCNVIRAL